MSCSTRARASRATVSAWSFASASVPQGSSATSAFRRKRPASKQSPSAPRKARRGYCSPNVVSARKSACSFTSAGTSRRPRPARQSVPARSTTPCSSSTAAERGLRDSSTSFCAFRSAREGVLVSLLGDGRDALELVARQDAEPLAVADGNRLVERVVALELAHGLLVELEARLVGHAAAAATSLAGGRRHLERRLGLLDGPARHDAQDAVHHQGDEQERHRHQQEAPDEVGGHAAHGRSPRIRELREVIALCEGDAKWRRITSRTPCLRAWRPWAWAGRSRATTAARGRRTGSCRARSRGSSEPRPSCSAWCASRARARTTSSA